MVDPAVLKNDILNGPLATAVATDYAASNDSAVAAAFNAHTGPGAQAIPNSPMPAEDFVALTAGAFANITIAKQNTLDYIAGNGGGVVKVGDSDMQSTLDSVLDGTPQLAAVQAQYTKMGSRAEVLFGIGTEFTPTDIGNARSSP